MDNGSLHQFNEKAVWSIHSLAGLSIVSIQVILFMQKFRYGMMEQVLTRRIYHIFLDRFYRGKRAVGDGIGIGLALARSIFELQNGTITAYNRRNGGACFRK